MPAAGVRLKPAAKTACAVFALLAGIACVAARPAAAGDLRWSAYSGRWGVGKAGETTELGLEARRAMGTRGFDLMIGLAGTADEAVWGYAGLSLGWNVSENWELRPGFGVSLFDEGDGRDLGGLIELRSSLELAYRLRQNLRVGLVVYHLSNAGVYDRNPGANSLVFAIGWQ